MSEAFNPYREWLGLEGDVEAPNYYQLLGLTPFEADRARLTTAADKAIVRVRGFRPGSRAADWARLLDELSQAKTCFQDPARKAAYDVSLRQRLNQSEPAPSPHDVAPQIAQVNQSPDFYPPGMAPKPPAGASGVSTNEQRVTVAPIRNAYPPGMAPMPEGTVLEGTVLEGTVLEGTVAAPAATVKPRPLPPSAGADSRAGVPLTDAPSDRSAVREPVPPGPVNAHVAPPRQAAPSLLPITAAVAGVLIVVTLIVLMIALRDDASGSPPAARDPLPAAGASVPALGRNMRDAKTAQPFVPSAPPVTQSAANKAPAASKNPAALPTTRQPPESPSDPAPPAAATDTNVPSAPGGSSTTTNPPVVVPDAPLSSPPTSAPPDASSANVPPANVTELNKALQQARAAIVDHEYRVAQRVLEKAGTLATSPEQKVLIERLRHLSQCAEQFWKVVANGTRQLNAAEELKVGSAEEVIVIVVEAGPDSVTIRRDGRNVKYTLADMPAGLALAIARRTVDENDARTLVLFGACLVTAKDMSPAYVVEAQRYWEQAKLRGADVDDLLELLAERQ